MQYIRKFSIFAICLLLVLSTIARNTVTIRALENENQYALMRDKFHDMAVGGHYDVNDPIVKPMLQSINDTAQTYWDNMNKNPVSNAVNGSYMNMDDTALDPNLDPSKDYIFPEYPLGKRRSGSSSYINANSIQFTYQYLRAMALAYETKGCSLYKNKDMLEDIKMALEFMNEYHYNEKFKQGSKSVPYGNWFSWRLGGPVYLGETLLLLYEDLEKEKISKYATTMENFVNWTSFTGANSTWNERVSMYTGLLTEKEAYMTHIQSVMPTVLKYTQNGDGSFPDGYYEDGTFIQHTTFPYNGGYGLMCLTDTSYLLYMLAGTKWDLGKESAEIVYDWVLDSYEPMVYNGLSMDAFRGREITRSDTTQPRGALIIANAMLMLCENAPESFQKQFKGCIKQWFGNDFMIEQMNKSADTPWYKFPLDTVVKVNKILNDESINPVTFDGTTYQMNNGARTIHWSKEGWAYTIAMASPTIKTYEGGDSNNKGWYIGNGATYLYTNDLERTEGVEKATKDWYRIPGATSVYGRNQGSQYNINDFSGGVTDGVYGVSGMDLSMSTHNLKAKKSWFMFDDEVVALGSDISGQYDVETTLENYKIDSTNRTYYIDSVEKTMTMDGSEVVYSDVKTMNMSGNVEKSDIGFYFPKGLDILVKSETRTGKWSALGEYNRDTKTYSADYFTVWTDHSEDGNGATDGAYAYVLLPGKNANETNEYAKNGDIEIIRQDDKVHAVYEKTLGMLGINFWQKGYNSVDLSNVKNYVTSDSAASVLINDTDNGLDVSITDTTQQNNGYITLEINREVKGLVSADEGIEVVQMAPTTIIKVNVKGADGKCFQVHFSYDDVELKTTSISNVSMDDDALVVSVNRETNAKSYLIHYGTESGQYTHILESQDLTSRIYGLTPGTTYYLNVQAKNGETVSELGTEVTFTTTATTTFFDEFETMDKMLSHSSHWGFDNGNAEKYFNGDSTRIKRIGSNINSVESIIYMLPGLQDFALEVYGYGSLGTIKMYTSQNGETWKTQDYKLSTPVYTKDSWFKQILSTPDNGVNENANYIKIEVCAHPTKVWAPQLTRFDATMRNASDLKLLKDLMQNDSKTYLATNIEFINYNGDDVAKAMNNNGELLYSYTNIQNGTIIAYVKDEKNIDVFTSKNGKEYSSLITENSQLETRDGYTKVIMNIPQLDNDTDYLKIIVPKDCFVSDVSFNYIPENSEIQYIRFEDKKIDAVIQYDIVPSIKTAPMNAQRTLVYDSRNDSIVTFKDGVVQCVKQGETHIGVKVDGTDVSATLPVTVYKDMALKKTVTASSVNSNYPVANAVDGDMKVTRWQSNSAKQEWIQVDLRKETSFDAIDLEWYSNGEKYNILISNDETNWKNVKSVTDAPYGKYARFDFETPLSARYVKIEGVSDSQYSLFALRILQKTGSENDVELDPWNLALNKTAYSSGLYPSDGTSKAEKYAVDGSTGTRWASNRSDDQWFYVDLQANCVVEAVNILWESASAKEFKLQISEDGNTWTDMAHVKNNTVQNNWTNHVFSQEYVGRYVRMKGITANLINGKNYGYSMYEFQVMGITIDNPNIQEINRISFIDTEMNMLKGQFTNLTAITDPANVTASSIAWESSDPSLVSVNSNGKITIKGESGTAIISAYSVNNSTIKAECTIHITPSEGKVIKVDEVTLMNVVDKLNIGDVHQLSVVITPENATHTYIIWTSNDESVIQVNADGQLTAIGLGKATISARTTAGTEAKVTITVDKSPVERVIDLINAIGEVTLESEDLIMTTKNAYQALSDSDKQMVSNYDKLVVAQKELERLKAELIKPKLQELVDKINGLDQDKYTEETWKALESQLELAQKVLDNKDAIQKEIDDAYSALLKVYEALEVKGSMDYDIPTIDTDKPVEDVTVAVKDANKANDIIIGSVSNTLQKKINEIINQGIKVTTKVSIDTIDETNASETVKNDMTAITTYIKEKNFKIGEYFDITLSIVANNKELGTVTETTEKIAFQIAVPKELQKEGRTFKVIRIHGSDIRELETKEENGILTFESDQFSTYALVYSDKVETTVTPNPTPNPGEGTNKPSSGETVNTGDQNSIGLYAGIAMLSLLGVFLVKRKEEN